jgi:hypothetical protein
VLGGGDRVAAGSIHDHDPSGGGGLHVDVIEPGTRPADHLELGRAPQNLLGHLGSGANHQAVVLTD